MKKFFKLLRKIGYLIAFSLILYPVVSNYINQQHSSTIATDYDQKVSHLSEKEEAKMIKKAREYNKSLIGISSFLDPFSQEDGNQTEDDIYNRFQIPAWIFGRIKAPRTKALQPQPLPPAWVSCFWLS